MRVAHTTRKHVCDTEKKMQHRSRRHAKVRELIIVSPVGFRFPVLCGDLCFPGPDKLAGTPEMRRSAILRQNDGTSITYRIQCRRGQGGSPPEATQVAVQPQGGDAGLQHVEHRVGGGGPR